MTPTKTPHKRYLTPWQRFFKWEASTGILLLISAILALIVANSAFYPYYLQFLDLPVFAAISTSTLHLPETMLLFINDALMAAFFLLVGLEIKREFVTGELSSLDRAILPVIAAACGMAAPALIYLVINMDSPENFSGWAIPAATDIAFAIGAISLLGSRVSLSLKVFLVAVAVIDDLGAILIIATFYTSGLHLVPLAVAFALLLLLVILNRKGVTKLSYYLIPGFFIWLMVLQSGIHPTVAGVAVAMCIPTSRVPHAPSPVTRLEGALFPWINFLVLPLFGFANAGVNLTGTSLSTVFEPIPLGIILGLFFGKQVGIFIASFLAIKLKIARRPDGSWAQLYGVSMLCGIGFTMSLFIGALAFNDPQISAHVRIGVLVGSLISCVVGFTLLRALPPIHGAHKPKKAS